jgi:hypothetical protein
MKSISVTEYSVRNVTVMWETSDQYTILVYDTAAWSTTHRLHSAYEMQMHRQSNGLRIANASTV